ncbi:hypothetical protein FRC03_009808 [Tulasnella sp. 419]|nr:hypothetical protein FRC03_009808 [Tulasnella sp. 419]
MNTPDMSDGPQIPEALKPLVDTIKKYQRMYQYQIDRTAPHTFHRWLATGGLNILFMLRIVLAQGMLMESTSSTYFLRSCNLNSIHPWNKISLPPTSRKEAKKKKMQMVIQVVDSMMMRNSGRSSDGYPNGSSGRFTS